MENWASANSLTYWTKESGVTLAQETLLKNGGNYSAKMQLTGVTDARGIWQDVQVVAGNSYTLKAWLYDAGGTAKIGISIIWYTADKVYLYKYAGPEKTTTENAWQQVSLAATAPANAGYARCRIRIYDSNDSPCYADDAEFYEDVPLSVQVNSCYAVCQDDGISVHWQTGSEVGTLGFHVLRSESESGPFYPVSTAMIPGQRNSSMGKDYIFVDKNIVFGKTYWYQIEEIEENGSRKIVGTVETVSRNGESVPETSALLSNYPNPFNPSTIIRFQVSWEEVESGVSLSVYSILGREIKTLASRIQKPGEYTAVWDGCDMNGRDVANGVYFCVLKLQEKVIESRRMMKLK